MERIKKYIFSGQIGEGTFSKVHKVTDCKTEKGYAAKCLKEEFKSHEDAMNLPETQAIKLLKYHENIVETVDIIFNEQTKQLIMLQELANMNLYEYLQRNRRGLSEIRAKSLLYQLVSGIKHMHTNGLFHRDIKPENILITLNNRINNKPSILVQLSDFGTVGFIGSAKPHSAYISTRWYRAPEILLTSGYYNHKIDIWAMGCVFYEILTNSPLFPGETELDQLNRIHEVLGSPTNRILKRFGELDNEYNFDNRQRGCSLLALLPTLSGNGMDVLRQSLQYHPDFRPNISKLYEHRYFSDLKCYKQRSTNNLNTERQSMCDTNDEVGKLIPRRHFSFELRAYHEFKTKPAVQYDPSIENKLKERMWGMKEGFEKLREKTPPLLSLFFQVHQNLN